MTDRYEVLKGGRSDSELSDCGLKKGQQCDCTVQTVSYLKLKVRTQQVCADADAHDVQTTHFQTEEHPFRSVTS